MSNILSTLKVRLTADTSELKKGAGEGKKAIKEMTNEAGNSMSSFAELFGADMDAISGQIGSFKTVMKGMGAIFSGAAAGSGIFSKALGILKGAIIATGIGALIVVLGSLIAYFTSTGAGADKLNQIMAAGGAVVRVITDQFAKLGEIIINAFSNPKKTISDLWEFIKGNFINRFTAIPKLIQSAWNIVKSIFTDTSLKDAALDFASASAQAITGLDKSQQSKIGGYFKNVSKEIAGEASAAYKLQGALEDLEDQERKMSVLASEREKQIKALRLVSSDESNDAKTRLEANRKAMKLELANVNDQKKLAQQLVDIQKQKLALNSDSKDDELDELAEAEKKLNDIEGESLVTQKKLQSEYNNLSEAINKKTQALIDDRKKQDENLKTITPATKQVTPELANGDKLKSSWYVDVVPTVDYGTIVPDTQKAFAKVSETIKSNLSIAQKGLDEFAYNANTTIIEIGSVIESAMEEMAVGVAEAFGSMMAGADFSTFSSIILSSIADLLITVGKMVIQAGLTIEALKQSLRNIGVGGVGAVVAGMALVALGTMVKSGIASAASGGSSGISSAGSSVTSVDTRSSSSAASSKTSTVQVEVTGEFKQRGSDLVAVVTKENNRKSLTT